MSEHNNGIETDQHCSTLPAGAHGVLSTSLTDNGPGYAWFDCEAEL